MTLTLLFKVSTADWSVMVGAAALAAAINLSAGYKHENIKSFNNYFLFQKQNFLLLFVGDREIVVNKNI